MKWGILLILCATSSVYAQLIINNPRGDISKETVYASKLMIEKMIHFSPLNLTPEKLIIDLFSADTEAYYSPGNYLYLPLRLRSYTDHFDLQTKELTAAVWVHEIAHSILNVNLDHDLPLFREVFSVYRQRDIILAKLEDLERNTPSHEEMYAKLKKINAEMFQLQQKLIPIIPYDELFADIYTVLYFKDFKIMKKALTFKDMHPEEIIATRHRDFTVEIPYAKDQDHTFLSPSKNSFWKRVKDCSQASYEDILKQVYRIISFEIEEILDGKIKSQSDANNILKKKFSNLHCVK